MISCTLLAAGLSERFGSPKALARLENSSVIEHVLTTLLQSDCDEIIVVLGAHSQEIEPSIFIHRRIHVVYNKNYNFGQTSSLQAGWHNTNPNAQGVLLFPVDCPLVLATSINKIIHQFKRKDPDILIPTYQNKKGHPPILNQRLKSKILNLSMDVGLNSLFKSHPPQTIEIDDDGIIKSFNTPQELESIRITSKQ